MDPKSDEGKVGNDELNNNRDWRNDKLIDGSDSDTPILGYWNLKCTHSLSDPKARLTLPNASTNRLSTAKRALKFPEVSQWCRTGYIIKGSALCASSTSWPSGATREWRRYLVKVAGEYRISLGGQLVGSAVVGAAC
jgi:hypothetical protein